MKNEHDRLESFDDELFSGDLNDDLGAAIGAALGDLRVDEEEFAEGVARRIEEGKESIRKSGPGRVMAATWARNAAAFLPPFMIPRGVAEAGLTAGGLAIKKSAWKWIPGVLALPALVFTMLIGSFIYGVRNTRVEESQGTVDELAAYEIRMWWKSHRLASILVLIVLWYTFRTMPAEAVTVFSVISMFALVGILRALASTGLASRSEVGLYCGEYLLSTVVWAYLLMSAYVDTELGPWSRVVMPLLPLVGGGLCLLLAQGDRVGWALERKRRRKSVVVPVLIGLVMIVFLILFTGVKNSTRADAVHFAGGDFRNEYSMQSAIVEAVRVQRHLLATEGLQADGAAIGVEVTGHLKWVRDGHLQESINERGLMELDSFGWIPKEDFELFRDSVGEESLLKPQRRMGHMPAYYLHAAVLDALGELTEAERDLVAEKALGGVGEEVRYGALQDLWGRVQILERLDRGERVDELAGSVKRALLATWTGVQGSSFGCFTSSEGGVESDGRDLPFESLDSAVMLDATDFALRLMVRFGVPEGVELSSLRRYLVKKAQFERMGGADPDNYLAAAMVDHVDLLAGGVPLPEARGIWGRFAELRMLFAVALLVIFCLLTTWRAPLSLAEEC